MRAFLIACLLSAVPAVLGSALNRPADTAGRASVGDAAAAGLLTGNLRGGIESIGPSGAPGTTISIGGSLGGNLGGRGAGAPSVTTRDYATVNGWNQGYGYGQNYAPHGYNTYGYNPYSYGSHGYNPYSYGSHGYSPDGYNYSPYGYNYSPYGYNSYGYGNYQPDHGNYYGATGYNLGYDRPY